MTGNDTATAINPDDIDPFTIAEELPGTEEYWRAYRMAANRAGDARRAFRRACAELETALAAAKAAHIAALRAAAAE